MASEPRDLGPHLFDIAVVADTHVNETEYGSASPYECNRLANARTRHVIHRLNELRPELVIHLGDLVHPVPALPAYGEAARSFKALTSALQSPLHLVPGNHDVGDKPVVWAPAGVVSEASLAVWEEQFGAHYYSFDFRGLHVVVLDAQIINSGLPAEAEQRRWVERDLQVHAGRRTFVCMHYPPYVSDPGESESYDNLAEPGRAWLLGLLEAHRPEALFCGHVHNFWYNRHAATECYILPSTAFVRQDYSDLYRGEPGDEAGRNDIPKLGFVWVRVHERGHVCHVVRTYGAALDPGVPPPSTPESLPPLHATQNRRAPLGLDLRHPWAEVLEITPTGALDEFERKRVRNDYPLLALWEMGVRKLRVPFQDLEDPRVRERMRLLRTLGHEFTVYTLGVPRGAAREVLLEHHALVDVWEVIASWPEIERTLEAVGEVKEKAAIRAYLSKLRSKEDVHREGARYYHFINHGFVAGEGAEIEACLGRGGRGPAVDGVVLRVVRHAAPWEGIAATSALAGRLGLGAAVHVRMASTNPAERFTDDLANASRIAEALAAALGHAGPDRPAVDVFVDTFADIDRGYFVRTGLVDRRYNPRLASHVVRHLYAALNASAAPLRPGRRQELPDGVVCALERPGEVLALVAPARKLRLDRVPAGTARWIDLATGHVGRVPWQRAGAECALEGGLACGAPVLVSVEA